jgi:hypothetical protein
MRAFNRRRATGARRKSNDLKFKPLMYTRAALSRLFAVGGYSSVLPREGSDPAANGLAGTVA